MKKLEKVMGEMNKNPKKEMDFLWKMLKAKKMLFSYCIS